MGPRAPIIETVYFLTPAYFITVVIILSKCTREDFHTLLELNAGQHVFEWKNTLKGVKGDF